MDGGHLTCIGRRQVAANIHMLQGPMPLQFVGFLRLTPLMIGLLLGVATNRP
jgi:hypothetical protein